MYKNFSKMAFFFIFTALIWACNKEDVKSNINFDLVQEFDFKALNLPKPSFFDMEDNVLYTLNPLSAQVIKIDIITREVISKYGEKGKAPGEFMFPADLKLYGNNLLITDYDLNRVSIIDKNTMKYIDSFSFDIFSLDYPRNVMFAYNLMPFNTDSIIFELMYTTSSKVGNAFTKVANYKEASDIYKEEADVSKKGDFLDFADGKSICCNNKIYTIYPFHNLIRVVDILDGSSFKIGNGNRVSEKQADDSEVYNHDIFEREGKIYVLYSPNPSLLAKSIYEIDEKSKKLNKSFDFPIETEYCTYKDNRFFLKNESKITIYKIKDTNKIQ